MSHTMSPVCDMGTPQVLFDASPVETAPVDRHYFVPDEHGAYCLACSLPHRNRRHVEACLMSVFERDAQINEWKLAQIRRVLSGDSHADIKATDLLYILSNHPDAPSMIEALVSFYIGEPF